MQRLRKRGSNARRSAAFPAPLAPVMTKSGLRRNGCWYPQTGQIATERAVSTAFSTSYPPHRAQILNTAGRPALGSVERRYAALAVFDAAQPIPRGGHAAIRPLLDALHGEGSCEERANILRRDAHPPRRAYSAF